MPINHGHPHLNDADVDVHSPNGECDSYSYALASRVAREIAVAGGIDLYLN